VTEHQKDDRYRAGQQTENIIEALWEVALQYGIDRRIASDEQVVVARSLRATLAARSGPLKRQDILGAFEKFQLRRPPDGYAKDVIARLERLDR